MNEYTPTTDEIRECWAAAEVNEEGYTNIGLTPPTEDGARAEFDRWLASVKAEVLLEAIAEYAITITGPDGYTTPAVTTDDLLDLVNEYQGK